MFGIVKKDSFFFLIAIFLIYPSILILWKISGKAFDMQFAVLVSFLLHFLLYGPMIINEQDEDKSNGYAVLSTLPVKLYEIVFAKFFFVFVFVFLFVLLNSVILSLALETKTMFNFARNVLIISGIFGMVFSAIFYIGVFMFGFSNFFRFGISLFGVIFLSAGVIAQLLFIKKVNLLNIIIEGLSNFIHNVNISVLAISCIVIFIALMLAAVKIKSLVGVK